MLIYAKIGDLIVRPSKTLQKDSQIAGFSDWQIVRFSDCLIPRSPDSQIPGFPDPQIPGLSDPRIDRLLDYQIPGLLYWQIFGLKIVGLQPKRPGGADYISPVATPWGMKIKHANPRSFFHHHSRPGHVVCGICLSYF
jgi:hypothetical protein